MFRHFFSIFLFIAFLGCTTSPTVNLKENYDQVYITNGVEQYFLANLPHWANFSTQSSCHRKKPIRFFNFENLKKSFSLDYEKMVHLQHMFNRQVYTAKLSMDKERIPPKDESFIFNNTYQNVIGVTQKKRIICLRL